MTMFFDYTMHEAKASMAETEPFWIWSSISLYENCKGLN